MNLHPDLSFIAMVTHASLVVQSVMALLLVLSFWSWWQIFLKMFVLRRAVASTNVFEEEFWKGGDLAALYQRASQARDSGTIERIFSARSQRRAVHSAKVVFGDHWPGVNDACRPGRTPSERIALRALEGMSR